MLKQLQAVKMELCKRMYDAIAKTGAWLNQMLKGATGSVDAHRTRDLLMRHAPS
jgi:hypothetical protein